VETTSAHEQNSGAESKTKSATAMNQPFQTLLNGYRNGNKHAKRELERILLGNIAACKKELSEKRAALCNTLQGQQEVSMDSPASGIRLEYNSDFVLLRQEIQVLANGLNDLMGALGRVGAGDFGFCSNCGTEIPCERLELCIQTDQCLKCKKEGEKSIPKGCY